MMDFGNLGYFFIAIALRSTLARSGCTGLDPIHGLDRTVRNLNCVQANKLCRIELLEMELFGYLTLCKKMTNANLTV